MILVHPLSDWSHLPVSAVTNGRCARAWMRWWRAHEPSPVGRDLAVAWWAACLHVCLGFQQCPGVFQSARAGAPPSSAGVPAPRGLATHGVDCHGSGAPVGAWRCLPAGSLASPGRRLELATFSCAALSPVTCRGAASVQIPAPCCLAVGFVSSLCVLDAGSFSHLYFAETFSLSVAFFFLFP